VEEKKEGGLLKAAEKADAKNEVTTPN